MSRNPRIEAIIAEWWKATYGEPAGQDAARRQRDRLIDDHIQMSGVAVTREQVLESLYGHFKEYRRLKAQELVPKMPPKG